MDEAAAAGAWTADVPCRLCGGRDFRALFAAARSGRRVVRCRGCGLVFYHPQPTPEQAAALYTSAYFARELPEAGAEARAGRAARGLARIEAETGVGSLLDVGCGTGLFLSVARARGWHAAGLDVSPAAVHLGRARGMPVFEGDLTGPAPEGLGPVDVVTLWDVLEHLTDPVAALAAAPRWLRPGGLLVVQTQNVGGVTAAWMGRRWEQFVEFHLYHFSSRTLRAALERADFEEIRVHDVAAFAGAGAPAAAPDVSAPRRTLRRLRDRLWRAAGYDTANVIVATARRPGR